MKICISLHFPLQINQSEHCNLEIIIISALWHVNGNAIVSVALNPKRFTRDEVASWRSDVNLTSFTKWSINLMALLINVMTLIGKEYDNVMTNIFIFLMTDTCRKIFR